MTASYPTATHRRKQRYDQTYPAARLAPRASTGSTHEQVWIFLVQLVFEPDLTGLRVDQVPVLVVGLIRQCSGDLHQVRRLRSSTRPTVAVALNEPLGHATGTRARRCGIET
jgi:hypothetical protein